MKITFCTKKLQILSVLALGFAVSCGSVQEQTFSESNVDEMPADLIEKQSGVMVMVEVDEKGKITRMEKRTVAKDAPEFSDVNNAEAAFQNASTNSYVEDTSADSFYTTGYANNSFANNNSFSNNSFVNNNGFVNNGFANNSFSSSNYSSSNVNYNSAWNGFNYAMPSYSYNSTSFQSTNIINNSSPVVFGCGAQNFGCFNYAYAAWPTAFVNTGNNFFGYRYPCARSYFRPCGGGCRRFFYRW